ncbi:MAG TPA: CotH kinase family protein [Petrotogaceae bacterium]|nr:CotH kinase family protein [Petrotogaceae bacterium]
MMKEKAITVVTVLSVCCAVLLIIWLVFFCDLSGLKKSQTPEYMVKIFDKNQIIDINIFIDKEKWTEMLENATAQEYYTCNVSVNSKKYYNVGIRTKGNASLSMIRSSSQPQRYSFKLDFGEYVKDQTLFGLQKIALNNMIGDASYMKEYMSYEMFSALGVPVPGYAYASISVNGEPWGFYIANEDIDDTFVERYYDDLSKVNVYKPETMEMNGEDGQQPGGFGRNGSTGTNLVYTDDNLSSYSGIFDYTLFETTGDDDKMKAIEMMKSLSTLSDIEKHINTEEVLKYFAVNTFLVNLDSYAGSMKHNYYLLENNGLFEILPWDLHLSFGAFQMQQTSRVINFPIDAPVTDSMQNSPLISKLLEVDKYKTMYHSYLQKLIQEFIDSGKYYERIKQVSSMIDSYVKNDSMAFYTYEEYQSALENMIIYGKDRTLSIKAQLEGSQPSTEYGNIQSSLNLTALGTMGGGKNVGDRMMNTNQQSQDFFDTADASGTQMRQFQAPGEQNGAQSMPNQFGQPPADMQSMEPPDNQGQENMQPGNMPEPPEGFSSRQPPEFSEKRGFGPRPNQDQPGNFQFQNSTQASSTTAISSETALNSTPILPNGQNMRKNEINRNSPFRQADHTLEYAALGVSFAAIFIGLIAVFRFKKRKYSS